MGWMQTAVGGRIKGLHQTVVELARFHNAFVIFDLFYITVSCISPNRVRKIWSQIPGKKWVASFGPNYSFRGIICCGECVQFCADYFPVSSWPIPGPVTNLTRVYVNRYCQVFIHFLSRFNFICVWIKSAILVLQSKRARREPIVFLYVSMPCFLVPRLIKEHRFMLIDLHVS